MLILKIIKLKSKDNKVACSSRLTRFHFNIHAVIFNLNENGWQMKMSIFKYYFHKFSAIS